MRVRVNRSGNRDYVQVVDEYREDGRLRTKLLKSFKQKTPESFAQAHQFLGQYKALLAWKEAVKEQGLPDIQVRTIALAVFGLILGVDSVNNALMMDAL